MKSEEVIFVVIVTAIITFLSFFYFSYTMTGNVIGAEKIYYVSASGLSTNPGTLDQPLTFSAALSKVSAGDTIIALPGSYGRITVSVNGSSGGYITIKGQNAPIITFPNNSSLVPTGKSVNPNAKYDGTNAYLTNPAQTAKTQGFDISGSYIKLQNFEITNVSSGKTASIILGNNNIEISNNYIHEPGMTVSDPSAIYSNGKSLSNINILNNIIWRQEGYGIYVQGTNWLVEGNDVSHGSNKKWKDGTILSTDADASRAFGSNHIFRNNYFHDYLTSEFYATSANPHSDGIQFWHQSGDSNTLTNFLVENNRIINMDGQSIIIEDEVNSNNAHDIIVRNNILSGTHFNCGNIINIRNVPHFTLTNNVLAYASSSCSWGLEMNCNCPYALIANNIFYNNQRVFGYDPNDEVCGAPTRTGFKIEYNLYYPSASGPSQSDYGSTNKLLEPKFVSSAINGNFHAASSASPNINTGVDINTYANAFGSAIAFSTDRDGVTRPQGSAWDIGPYEYNSGASTPADTVSPIISNIQSLSITNTSILITWSTNESSDSIVEYGTTASLGKSSNDSTMTTYHSISLTGLAAGTQYYYRIKSKDSAGNTATSQNYTFTTLKNQAVDTTAPNRSSGSPLGNLESGTTQITLSLITNENSTCKYSASSNISYNSMTNSFSTILSTFHSKSITGLTDGKSYSYYIKCIDTAGNVNQDDYFISFIINNATVLTGYFQTDSIVEAENGTASGMSIGSDPLASGGKYVYASSENHGSVNFSFNIITAGNYTLKIKELSANDASNSFSIYLNNQYLDVYDSAISTLYVYDNVSLRGTGTYDINQYDPKVFVLNKGIHTFSFAGREANLRLDQVSLEKVITSAQKPALNDTTAPVILNVQALSITNTSILITWSTNESSDSIVEYGTTASLGKSSNDSTMTTYHSISLTGLAAGTQYYYRIKSKDSAGNTATSQNYTFTTLKNIIVFSNPIQYPPSPATYNVLKIINFYQFNITVSKTPAKVWITMNNKNYTKQIVQNGYRYSFSRTTLLGDYQYQWFARDSDGKIYSSDKYYYKVNLAL